MRPESNDRSRPTTADLADGQSEGLDGRKDAGDAFERSPGDARHERTRPSEGYDAPHTSRPSDGEHMSPEPRRTQPSRAAVMERPSIDGGAATSSGALLPESDGQGLRQRWEDCQRSFVDSPRESVKAADELVAELMQKLASQFAETRRKLEGQWQRGGDVSTEDLRVALQRYRDFFNRLLAV